MLEDKQSPPKPKRQQPKVTPKKYPIKNTGAIPKRRGQKLQFSQDTLDVSLEPRVHEQPRDELLLSQQGQPTPEDLLHFSPDELALEFPKNYVVTKLLRMWNKRSWRCDRQDRGCHSSG